MLHMYFRYPLKKLPEAPLGSEIRHEAFPAFKEALTNVARHSEARNAWIRANPEPHGLILKVEDDGRGLDADKAGRPGGHGMRNMRERLERVGGRCTLRERPGGGTIVEFHVPVSPGLR